MERVVAVVIFYDQSGRVLLQDRTGISKVGEEWGYFGGQTERGETPEQALKREIREELEYNLTDYLYVAKYRHEVLKDFYVVEHIFVAPLGDKLPRFRLREGAGMRLFPLAEAMRLKFPKGSENALVLAEMFIRNGSKSGN